MVADGMCLFARVQVRSYNPRTSFGEHQFFVYVLSGDAATVHVPVVPARRGAVRVRLHAATLMGTHRYTKTIHVEVPTARPIHPYPLYPCSSQGPSHVDVPCWWLPLNTR